MHLRAPARLGAFGGDFVDRHDRRRVLIGTELALGAIAGTFGARSIADSSGLWMLYVAALGSGLVMAIDQPAGQVFVVELVGSERVANAISLNEVVINASRALGPRRGARSPPPPALAGASCSAPAATCRPSSFSPCR